MRYWRSTGTFKRYKPSWKRPAKRHLAKRRRIAASEPLFRNHARHYQTERIFFNNIKKYGIFALMLGWLVLLIYLPYFRITQVTYAGLSLTQPEEIKPLVENYLISSPLLPTNNYFLIRPQKLIKILQKTFAFSAVEIKKIFPNTLAVTVDEKTSTIVYDTGESYFLLDPSGTAIKYLGSSASSSALVAPTSTTILDEVSASTTTPLVPEHAPNVDFLPRQFKLYPLVYDKSATTSIVLGSPQLLSNETIKNIIKMHRALKEGRIASPSYFIVGGVENNTTIIHTDRPWLIYFNPQADVQTQFDSITTILKNSKPQSYVDVRFGERVYWK